MHAAAAAAALNFYLTGFLFRNDPR